MSFTSTSNEIFRRAIADYHVTDNVDTPISNPFPADSINHTLYHKCWIDTVQWHFEDIIRDPNIDPAEALVLKRRIDKSNQDRTDMVENIDTYFRTHYADVQVLPDATINTDLKAYFSRDGGTTWISVATDVAGQSLTFTPVPPRCR